MAVTLAGQGVIKKHPTSLSGTSCLRANSRLAISAATSMGWRMSTMWSIKSGNRTWISRTMAGHAAEISGLGRSGWRSFSLMARVTTSAPRATSNTSSKPMCFRPVSTWAMLRRFLNWPYSEGAGRAILYLNRLMEDSGSVTAILAWYSHTRMHSPQSMQRSSIICALPPRTRIASVGQRLRQLVQALHLSFSSRTE